jgi:hypothetical protein
MCTCVVTILTRAKYLNNNWPQVKQATFSFSATIQLSIKAAADAAASAFLLRFECAAAAAFLSK